VKASIDYTRDMLLILEPKIAQATGAPVPAFAMRVGPGTDAVVWKICDTTETNEL
jgi:hypothetical protein